MPAQHCSCVQCSLRVDNKLMPTQCKQYRDHFQCDKTMLVVVCVINLYSDAIVLFTIYYNSKLGKSAFVPRTDSFCSRLQLRASATNRVNMHPCTFSQPIQLQSQVIQWKMFASQKELFLYKPLIMWLQTRVFFNCFTTKEWYLLKSEKIVIKNIL